MALAPTARLSLSSRAAGIVLALASGTRGRSLKPKASAIRTRRVAPSLAPSGAKTELHESTNDCVSEPPHDSPPALRSLTPESVANVRTG